MLFLAPGSTILMYKILLKEILPKIVVDRSSPEQRQKKDKDIYRIKKSSLPDMGSYQPLSVEKFMF